MSAGAGAEVLSTVSAVEIGAEADAAGAALGAGMITGVVETGAVETVGGVTSTGCAGSAATGVSALCAIEAVEDRASTAASAVKPGRRG